MSLWDSVLTLFHRDAHHSDRPIIPLTHISPALTDTASLAGGEGYFQLWVVQMFLKSDRDWFKGWYPIVQSLTRLRFGNVPNPVDIAQIAGPRYLRDVDPDHLDRVVQVDLPLTPLVPFNGGTVEIEAGLVAMPQSDSLKLFLDVMGNFAGLLAVPQLSTALHVANAVSKGVEQLLGVGNKKMVLGYHRALESAGGEGDNELRPVYIAVINAPSGTYKPEQLWIKDAKLLTGPDLASARELSGVDFMLLRIETRRARDDWDTFTSINEPFNKAMSALTQVDASGKPNVADAAVFIRVAAVAAMTSPDLTARDRVQVARAIRQRYDEYKAAVLGEKGIKRPRLPVLADVARAARDQDAGPLTLGELFPLDSN